MTAPRSTGQPARRITWGDMLWLAGFGAVIFAMVLALATAMVPAAELPAPKPVADETATAAPVPGVPPVKDPALVFVLETGSRLYPDWKEERRVHVGEYFILGDTKNEAVVEALYPDFRIIDGKAASISDSLGNPAVRVLVRRDSAVVDSSWAFLNFPPHFSPKSFFTFQLKDIHGWTGPGAGVLPAAAAAAGSASHGAAVATPAAAHAAQPVTTPATPSSGEPKPSAARKPE